MEQMNITSAQYSTDLSGKVNSVTLVVDNKTLYVPLDPANRHYAEIMRQVEAGELVIQPADEG